MEQEEKEKPCIVKVQNDATPWYILVLILGTALFDGSPDLIDNLSSYLNSLIPYEVEVSACGRTDFEEETP